MGQDYKIDGHKLDMHIDRVHEWKFRGDTTPVYVEVSPTAACNHSCTFCALDYANHTTDRIQRHKLIEMGEMFARLGVRGVMFGGEGEPTLHPDMAEVVGCYHGNDIDVAMTTNGAALDGDFAMDGGEFLKWVKVSLNGGDAETYAKVHRVSPSTFEDTWRNIRDFRLGCRHHEPVIGVQSVIVAENVDSLVSLCKRAVGEGLDYVVLKPFSYNSYSSNSQKVTLPDYRELDAILVECTGLQTPRTRIVVRDAAIRSVQSIQNIQYSKCLSVPYFWFYVNSKGDVVGCPNHMKDERFILGNLHTRTLQDIWYSHSGMKREELKAVMRDFDVSQCRKACRMDRVNEWLWKIGGTNPHSSFI